MNTVEKRDYIHNYLFRIDDKNIDEMFRKIRTLVEKDIALTHAQEEEINKRVLRHNNGESKSFSWPDVRSRAKAG